MAISLSQFHKHLAGSELKPVYLLAGEEPLLLLEAADALRARAKALGYAEREVLEAGGNFDWNAFTQSACAMSLFASRKVIDVRLPSGKPGKEGASILVEYCNNPPVDTLLLITCIQWSKAHETAWVGAVQRVGMFVPIWPLKLSELPAWIETRMRSRQLQPERDAVALLVDRVEGNLLAAAQEIDKLALLRGPGSINAEMLQNIIVDSARFDVFQLSDAACAGDAARALRILEVLRLEGEQVPALLGWILNQLQLLARLSAAGNNLSATLRSERVWPARENLYRKALARGSCQHWGRCLVQAARIDRVSKGRAAGDAWCELERLLVMIAQPETQPVLLVATVSA